MDNFKSSIEDLSSNSQDLAQEYVKFYALKASKKLALLAGILITSLVLSLFLLLIVMLLSFTFAGILNRLLSSEYAGYLIMMGIYLLSFGAIIYKIIKSKTPLFTNLFVRVFAFVFEIENEGAVTLDTLDEHQKHVLEKIETDKKLLNANLKLFKYVLIEKVFVEVFGFFSSRAEKKSNNNQEGSQET